MDDMRIGVDARPLTGPPAGIKTYLSELLNTVAGLDGRHEFILYAHRPITFDVPSSQFQVRIRRMLMDVGTLWLQLYAPALAAADGVDLFWGADFLLPLGLPRRIPAAVTVYDLVPFLFPQTMQLSNYLITLVKALASLPRATRTRFSLLVAGAPGWKTSALHDLARPLLREGTLRFLGFVSREDLPWLYAGAAIFLFPSLYEGFGIPVIEAMASGVPVVGSDIPVIREVARGAAVLVAPTAADSWAEAIVDLLDDPPRQAAMRERGLARAAGYTFDRSARRLLDVFATLAGGAGS